MEPVFASVEENAKPLNALYVKGFVAGMDGIEPSDDGVKVNRDTDHTNSTAPICKHV